MTSAAPRSAREIGEELGEAAAFVVGVGAGGVVELRQRALEVVPDEQHLLLLHELDRAAPLLAGRELVEVLAGDVATEDLYDALGAGELLEAHEARAVAEEAAARPPLGRFAGERGLAHAAHGVHDDAALVSWPAQRTFERQQLARAAVEAIGRRRWKWAVFGPVFVALPRRRTIAAAATGVGGVGTADQAGEPRGTVAIVLGVGAVDPEQAVEVGRQW